MPVTRRLMKPGTFSLRLQPNTPYRVHSAVARFDQVVITPTRLLPIEGYTNANILAAAIYAGVITRTPSPTDIGGHGLEWYLGTPKGYGPGTGATQGLLTTAVTQTTATLSTWVSALCPPALSVGTVTNGALPTLTDSFQMVTRREALDAVVRQVGAEYRINPSGTIDAAAPDTLFGANPDVIITRKPEGRSDGYWGLEGSTIVKSTDTDEYISKAVVVTRGEGTAATATTVSGTTAFRDFAGNLMHVERYIDAPTSLAANATLIGNAAIAKFNGERRDLRLSSRTYAIDRFAVPGDNIFVFDPVAGLVDPANQVVFRGEVMSPLKLRVYGLTWPIEAGMGVYARRATGVGTYTYTDLTDWVVWENAEVAWEIGAPRRPLVGSTPAQYEGSVAYLPTTATVAARVAGTAGYIAKAEMTANSTTTTTTPIYPTSVTFTAVAGRRYRYTLQGNVASTVANDLVSFGLADGSGVILDQTIVPCPSTLASFNASLVYEEAISSGGSTTRQLSIYRNSGSGNVLIGATSTQRTKLLVEDIGPA
jgi:hypothetical protein